MAKVMTVFGASGNQGGSVIKAVLANAHLSEAFKIRAITRDASKPSVAEWTNKGVEVISADMSSPESVAAAVRGAHTVFLMTNFWASMSADTEISQGKAVVDACKAANVQHLIFSSLINTKKASNGRLPNISHFDGKAKIEEYIRQTGLLATFLLPGYFMSNLFDSIRKNEDGSYMLALPVDGDKAQFPLFDAAGDTGKFVVGILKAYPSCAGKQIFAATDYYTANRIVGEFGGVLAKQAAFVQLPAATFKSFLPPPVAQELLENHLLLEDPGYYAGADLDESKKMAAVPPTTWKEFVKANESKWA